MAPEQSEGKPAGEPADIYSLALVLYEALTGDNPVRGANPAETARRIGRPLDAAGPPATRSPRLAHRRDRRRPRDLSPGPLRPGAAALRAPGRPPAPRPRGHAATPRGDPGERGCRDPAGRDAGPRSARVPGPPPVRPGPRPASRASEAEPRVVVHTRETPRTGAPRRLALAALIALCCWEAIAGRAGLSLVLLVARGCRRCWCSAATGAARACPWAGCRAALAPRAGHGRPGGCLPGGRGSGPEPLRSGPCGARSATGG